MHVNGLSDGLAINKVGVIDKINAIRAASIV